MIVPLVIAIGSILVAITTAVAVPVVVAANNTRQRDQEARIRKAEREQEWAHQQEQDEHRAAESAALLSRQDTLVEAQRAAAARLVESNKAMDGKLDATHALAQANHTLVNSAMVRQMKAELRGNQRELVLLRANAALVGKLGLPADPDVAGETKAVIASIAELEAAIVEQEKAGEIANGLIAGATP